MIIEMSSNDIRINIVSRMLYWTEFIYLMVIRHDDDTAGMLSRCTLDTGAVLSKAVCFIFIDRPLVFLKELHHITVGGLIGHRTYCSCLKYIFFTENRAHILMGYRLVFPCEVQVDIRLLVSVETKEGGERNGISVTLHRCAAFRTVFFRHVYTAVIQVHVTPLQVFAFRADIMRFQRIYLGDAGHGCSQRRTYRASGAYQIAVLVGLMYQHLCRHIHDRIAVIYNRRKFLFQTFSDAVR